MIVFSDYIDFLIHETILRVDGQHMFNDYSRLIYLSEYRFSFICLDVDFNLYF